MRVCSVKMECHSFCREITDAIKNPARVSCPSTLITSDRISAARLDGRAAFFLWRRFCCPQFAVRDAQRVSPDARRCACPSTASGPFFAASSSTIPAPTQAIRSRGLSIVAAARITAASSSMCSSVVEAHRAHFEQLEHDQHLQRILRIARGIGTQPCDARKRPFKRLSTFVKGAPWPGITSAHVELRDRFEHRLLFRETAFAFQFRKDHAEAVFPQRVRADQHAFLRAIQHQRMRIVTGRAEHLPSRARRAATARRAQSSR